MNPIRRRAREPISGIAERLNRRPGRQGRRRHNNFGFASQKAGDKVACPTALFYSTQTLHFEAFSHRKSILEITEQAEVYPDLVAHSADGQIDTVKYQLLDSMLLNEVQRQEKVIGQQKSEIGAQKDQIRAGCPPTDLRCLVGEIDVLRSDEYANLPGCLDGVDVPKDQLNTVIQEVMHMVLDLHVSDEAKVVALSEVIQSRTRRSK